MKFININNNLYLRKIVTVSVSIVFIFLFFFSKAFAAYSYSDLKVSSESAVVIDANTGTVLYAYNKDNKVYPASTTKILSSLVALEKGKKNQTITVSQNALEGQKDRGTHVGLETGEKLSLEDALYAMILESANDAAIAVGENIGGSVDGFSKLMNEKAKSIGMKNSHFTNPHGWYDENHYSTPYDMALLTKNAYENSDLKKMLSAVKHTMAKTNFPKENYDIYPTHKMFPYKSHFYEFFVGGKPGYLEESRANLASIAKKDDITLIAYVAKNSVTGSYEDTKNLFNFIFDKYKNVKLEKDKSGNTFNSLIKNSGYKMKTAGSKLDYVTALLPKDYNKSKLEFSIENIGNYPIKKGDVIGYAVVKYNGEIASKTPIKAVSSLSKMDYFLHIAFKVLKIVLPCLLGFFLALILFLKFGNKRSKLYRILRKGILRM